MLNNLTKNKINLIIASLFTVIALVYSEFIVLDEEALVSACFIMFVVFAYQVMGGMIANELDDRAAKIGQELQKSFDSKKDNLIANIEFLKKQEHLTSEIEELFNFTQYQIASIANKRKIYLQNKTNTLVNQQLKLVSSKEKEILFSIQTDAINSFCNAVLEEFKHSSAQEARAQLLEESISTIGSLSTSVFNNDQN